MIVIKRDGQEEKYEREKICLAINKALKETGYEAKDNAFADKISVRLTQRYRSRNRPISVEEIQDDIERELMKEGSKNGQKWALEVAKSYMLYRYRHAVARDKYNELMDAIAEKVECKNIQNQNANVDERSFGGRAGEANNLMLAQYALDYCMSDMAKNNHINNEIYIHDLSSYTVGCHNCLSIPLDKLLANGFNTRQTDVRPAQSVSTAFQLVAVLFQLQSLQQFGGVSATHLDWTMVPYVRKSFYKHFKDGCKYFYEEEISCTPEEVVELSIDSDEYKYCAKAYKYAMDMTEREVYQAVEGMYHNLNTLQSRSGNQLPFTSINYGTCTLVEGRMIIKALLDVSIEGIGKLHKTSIFPCSIFQSAKGINQKEGDPNYDLFRLALKSTALRLYPNYCNVDWSNNAGYDKNDPRTFFSTMGKRKLIAHVKPFELC